MRLGGDWKRGTLSASSAAVISPITSETKRINTEALDCP